MFPPLLLPPGLQEQQQQPQQLPIDLLMPPHTQVLYSKQVCLFCEYFLHYVQEGITEPKTEVFYILLNFISSDKLKYRK